MTVVGAILGTITFLAITAVFTIVTWWLFKLALNEKVDEDQPNKETVS
ncbi:MAG: hypothetical protein ACTSQF_04910 [Candidatus Heimdallarchaeaceae archaeon]